MKKIYSQNILRLFLQGPCPPILSRGRGLLLGGLLALLFPAQAQSALSQWQAVPLVSQASLDAGNSGGEGGQVIQNIAADSTGRFLMMGTDVGGLYRSLDGGANWQPADIGYQPRGAAAFAIDPNNNSRILAVGCDSVAQAWNGLWLSTNQAASWNPVLEQSIKASRTYHDSVAFDASSVTVSSGVTYSAVAYWVGYSDGGGGLWKSTDGGRNWFKIQSTFADGIVKVNPVDGTVYVATANGFFRSVNGGTFAQSVTATVLGLDVIPTRPNNVYINETNGAYVSTNSGQNFTPLGNTGLPTTDTPGLRNLKVSPVNPQNMLMDDDRGSYTLQRHYYSNNGGNTWALCSFVTTQSFLPANPREWLYAWSPTNPNQAWTCGGDFISQTTDAGAHFSWANNGYNGFTCTGHFNFNPQYPNLLVVTSQDYNTAFTKSVTNPTTAWQYLDVSGQSWGGFTYGGYALNPSVLVAGNAQTWSVPATLMVSNNGGGFWMSQTVLGNNTQTACGDPADPSVAFWNNYRTGDGGTSWQPMSACNGVFTFNSDPSGNHELYGSSGPTVLKSTDHGLTWSYVITLPNTVMDVAYDWKNKLLYIADGSLYQFNTVSRTLSNISFRLGSDNRGHQGAYSVAVDPVDPDIVYVAWAGNSYLSSQAVRRSLDHGQTWAPLTLQPGDSGIDGGLEPQCVRVDPVTRYLFATCSGFGIWKYPPPSTATAVSGPPASTAVPFPFPNPARGPSPVQVTLTFANAVPKASLEVFTVAFRKVNEVELGDVGAGVTTITLPLTDKRNVRLANGLYYLVAQPFNGPSISQIGKMLILR